MIRTISVKQSPLIMVSFIICIISMGCTKTEMTKQDQTSTEQLTAVTKTEALTTEKETYTETTMEEPIRGNTHNIFKGTIGESEVQMNIRREGDSLTASYITQTDDEKTLCGEMKSPTEFELNDNEGGYLKGTVYDGNLKGTGNISGNDVTISMYLSTFMPIGYDHDDYYSGDRIMSHEMTSTEVENFAKQIKESITDKGKFIKLFRYPLDIRINKKVFLYRMRMKCQIKLILYSQKRIFVSRLKQCIQNIYLQITKGYVLKTELYGLIKIIMVILKSGHLIIGILTTFTNRQFCDVHKEFPLYGKRVSLHHFIFVIL